MGWGGWVGLGEIIIINCSQVMSTLIETNYVKVFTIWLTDFACFD